MTKDEKIKNILAFLCIVIDYDRNMFEKFMAIDPAYLLEKFEQYGLSPRYEADWGIHPLLRRTLFNEYCKKHHIDYEPII